MGVLTFPEPSQSTVPVELEMSLAGTMVVGASVAARATAFALPEFGIAFDLGRLSPIVAEQPAVFISHGHLDHLSAVLAYLNLRARFYQDPPPVVHAPSAVADGLRGALAVMPGMEGVRRRMDLGTVIRGAEPGDEFPCSRGKVRAFAVSHSVPSLGWAVIPARRSRPLAVYAGDGTVEPFSAAPELLDASFAIVECSFLERNRRVAARLSGHAHVLDWVEVAPQLRCDTLVLGHLPLLSQAAVRRLLGPLASAFAGNLVAWTG